jgi:hypothetical protein
LSREIKKGIKSGNKRSASKSRSRSRTTAVIGMGSLPQESTSHADTSVLGGISKIGRTINDSIENTTIGQFPGEGTKESKERCEEH